MPIKDTASTSLGSLMGVLESAKVSLLEQPLKRGREADLDGFKSKIPIAADESVLTLADVAGSASDVSTSSTSSWTSAVV